VLVFESHFWSLDSKKCQQSLEANNGLLIVCFFYYHWIDTSAGGLLVPYGIIHLVVSDSLSALT